MSTCLIALGSNLGDRAQQIDRSIELLAEAGLEIRTRSAPYETRAAGGPAGQTDYLNAAIRCHTNLSPQNLLLELQQVEAQLGRERQLRWGPRTIDLDLLLFNTICLDEPGLVIPHPRMAFRRFVLEPAAEVAGEMVHPTTGWTVRELRERLDTTLPYVSVMGGRSELRRAVAQQVAARSGCHVVLDHSPTEWESLIAAGGNGPNWQRQLEFLASRQSILSSVQRLPGLQTPAPDEYWLSDFGLLESRALANCSKPGVDHTPFENAWQQIPASRVFPKLVVWSPPAAATTDNDETQVFQAELERLIRQPRRSPVLTVQLAESGRAVDEISAALGSM